MRGHRRIPYHAWCTGYRKTALEAGELVTAVKVPLPVAGRIVATYKVSKRIDQDISAVCAAFALDVRSGTVDSARIAFGGMAAIPKRAREVEATLTGKPWSLGTVEAAMAAFEKDFQPLSDMRASSRYRIRVAANLLKRFYLEHSGSDATLRVESVAVG